MKTHTVEAWEVDEGDFVSLGGNTAFKVLEADDQGGTIVLALQDDEGEVDSFSFTPFETIRVVYSFEED